MKIITSLLVASTIALNAQVLATVNSEDVSKNDVENFLKATNSDIAYDKMDSKAKNLALHQTIEKTLLIQEAKKEKLDKSKDFLQTLEDFKKSLLVEQFMKSEFSKIKIIFSHLNIQ